MPGAQLTGRDGDDFLGKVKVKVGPVTSEFTGKAQFVEKDDDAYRAVIDGKGRDARGHRQRRRDGHRPAARGRRPDPRHRGHRPEDRRQARPVRQRHDPGGVGEAPRPVRRLARGQARRGRRRAAAEPAGPARRPSPSRGGRSAAAAQHAQQPHRPARARGPAARSKKYAPPNLGAVRSPLAARSPRLVRLVGSSQRRGVAGWSIDASRPCCAGSTWPRSRSLWSTGLRHAVASRSRRTDPRRSCRRWRQLARRRAPRCTGPHGSAWSTATRRPERIRRASSQRSSTTRRRWR